MTEIPLRGTGEALTGAAGRYAIGEVVDEDQAQAKKANTQQPWEKKQT